MTLLPALVLVLTIGLAGPAWAQTKTSTGRMLLSVGSTRTVSLRANPSTGYRWRLAAGESKNLSAVKITDAGFSRGNSSNRPPIGAPGLRQWHIEGRMAGSARAVFVYSRPWEHVPPARRHVLSIEVTHK